MTAFRRVLLALAVLVLVLQFVPVDRSNPPVEQDIAAPAPVDAILRRACYDCHSNETVWPWYSRVAPMSFLVAHDVHEGREHLNFSTWNRLTVDDRVDLLEELVEEVEAGGMPLPIYLPLHPEARLTDEETAALIAWARSAATDEPVQSGARSDADVGDQRQMVRRDHRESRPLQ